MDQAAKILRMAADLVEGDRAAAHGDAADSYRHIAALWNAYLGFKLRHGITADEALMMQALVKIGRSRHGRSNPDDYVDGAGYIGLAGAVHEALHPKGLGPAKDAPYRVEKVVEEPPADRRVPRHPSGEDEVEGAAKRLIVQMHGAGALEYWPDRFATYTDTRMDADDIRDLARAVLNKRVVSDELNTQWFVLGETGGKARRVPRDAPTTEEKWD